MTVDLLERQKLAALLLDWACESGTVAQDSPRYQAVVEGRTHSEYSSCADLAHWLLFRLGVRLPWVNRNEHLGWRNTVNISRLVTHSGFWTGQELDAGDILIIANNWPMGKDAHAVCVVASHGDGWLSTAEYGQPGGALKSRQIASGKWGSRTIRTLMRLADVLDIASEAGMLESPDLPEGLVA